MDIGYIFQQIQNSRHEGGFDCTFLDMEFISELISGYSSTFSFRCKMCRIETKIKSENVKNTNHIPINQALVNATLAIGM